MLEDLYYLSGILVNAGLIYSLYKLLPMMIKSCEEKRVSPERDVFIKKEEEGEMNLHSSQSVKSLVAINEKQNSDEQSNEEKEVQIENRLKMLNNYANYALSGKWSEYLSYVVGKKKDN